MKKTTLFTTLALVVIVAIALSTATFAWYSANNAVSATTDLQANAAGDSNLLISSDGANFATSLTIADKATLQPACPISAIAYNFDNTSFWNMKVNGGNKVTDVGSTGAGDIFIATIIVKNDATAGQDAAHVKAAVTITPDATDSKGLAADDDIEWVLIADGDVVVASSDYQWAAKNTTNPKDGTEADDTTYSNTGTSGVANDSKTVDIDAQGTKSFKLIIWLNKNVGNSNALGKMAVSVVFSTSATVLPTT